MKLILPIACFALCFSSSAFANEGAFRCPAPGTQIETSVDGHLVADTANGFDCRIKEGAKAFTMHAAFANSKNAAAYKDGAEKLWPLQVGKEVEYTTVCETTGCFRNTRYHNRLKVVGIEDIIVRAGSFHTYKVTIEVEAFDEDHKAGTRGESYHDLATIWWAPAIGYSVKYEWGFLSGFTYRSDRQWEATSVVMGSGVPR